MEQTIESFIIPKNKKRARDAKKAGFILAFISYPILLFLIFYVYVNISSFVLAFQKIDALDNKTFLSGAYLFDNFKLFLSYIFGRGDEFGLGYGFFNSIKTYFLNLIICMPLYLSFSYLIFKKCFLHNTIRTVSMLPQIISGFVIALIFSTFVSNKNFDAPLMQLFSKLNIVDSGGRPIDILDSSHAYVTCVIYAIWISFGTNLIVYPNAMKEINTEVIESSKLDGVSGIYQEMRYIILPLIFPTLETFLVTGVAGLFTNDLGLLTFYGGAAPAETRTIGYIYNAILLSISQGGAGATSMYPMMAAGGLIMTLIIAPITLLLRWLLEKYGPSTEA